MVGYILSCFFLILITSRLWFMHLFNIIMDWLYGKYIKEILTYEELYFPFSIINILVVFSIFHFFIILWLGRDDALLIKYLSINKTIVHLLSYSIFSFVHSNMYAVCKSFSLRLIFNNVQFVNTHIITTYVKMIQLNASKMYPNVVIEWKHFYLNGLVWSFDLNIEHFI